MIDEGLRERVIACFRPSQRHFLETQMTVPLKPVPMKMPLLKCVLPLTLLVLVALPSQAQDTDLAQGAEAFLKHYMDAAASADVDAIRGALASDGRFAWVEDGAVRYRSADDVLQGLASLPPDAEIVTELKDLEVVALGKTGAHAWGTFTTTLGSGEQAFSFGGAISFVLERQKDGWKLVGGHTSSPRGR